MKPAAGQVEGLLVRPDPGCRAILLYGPDLGLVRERAERAVKAIAGDPADAFRLTDLAAAEAAREPARLAEEAAALSLTGGRRVVRVRQAGDALAGPLERALAGPGEALIVIEAGELSPRSSLRRLCEGSEHAAAVPCYPPDAQALAALIRDMVGAAGKSIDPDAVEMLADGLAPDRQMARREVEKLLAYVGTESRIDRDAVFACRGDSAESTLDELVLAVGDGEIAVVDRCLERMAEEAVNAIALLRAAQRHFSRLHLAADMMASGATADVAMGRLRPPVFFKVQPRFRTQLRRWPRARLERVLARLVETEAVCKRTGTPAETVTGRLLLDIARAARS